MLGRNDQPRWSARAKLLVGSGVACVITIILLLFPMSVLAHSTLGGPTFHVNVGFDARSRDANWVPVQVTLRNDGADFTGTISINVPPPYLESGSSDAQAVYQAPVSLANGAQKRVTIYVPLYFGSQGSTQQLVVDLLNSNGQKVGSQTAVVRTLGPSDLFIGVLSDQSSGFGPLNAIALPNQTASIIVEQLNASTLPTMAEVLKNFDLIILDNFTTSTLSQEQLGALQSWVNQGGALVLVGGPEWRHTLSPLPSSLLPVTMTGTEDLPAGTSLLAVGGPTKGGPRQAKTSDAVHAPVTVSTATPLSGSTVVLASGSTPLLVQSPLGQGTICYLAFDPTLEPIMSWSSASILWKGLLLRTLGDQLVASGPNASSTGLVRVTPSQGGFDSLLQAFLPNTFPSIRFILILLLSYVLVLGPVRFLIVRHLKRRNWSWRITLSAIVVFSLLSYGLALQQKGTAIISDTASIIQLGRVGTAGAANSSAHVTTYAGVFVPNQGNFQVHIAGNSLVQPSNSQFSPYPSQQTPRRTIITASPGATEVNLQGVNIWTFHTVVAEQDRAVRGGIVSQLALKKGMLTGTVTNTLRYTLSDVYVLIGNSYTSLGTLLAGQTKQVNLSVDISTGSSSLLVDKIASNGSYTGLSFNASQLRSERQRHLAMLATLSGEYVGTSCSPGSPCIQPVPLVPGASVSMKGISVASGFRSSNFVIRGSRMSILFNGGSPVPPDRRDPLMLPGAPATLIGWVDSPAGLDNTITINGSQSPGVQEMLVQAPLDVDFANSGNLASIFVNSQLTDVQSQGNAIQEQFPGIYTMTTGSMTFEFTLPSTASFTAAAATISEPANLSFYIQKVPPSGVLVDASHLHTYLYNWRTRSWDAIQLDQVFKYSTDNITPYVGGGGRILLQFANQDSSVGTIVFGKPSLQLQGTAS